MSAASAAADTAKRTLRTRARPPLFGKRASLGQLHFRLSRRRRLPRVQTQSPRWETARPPLFGTKQASGSFLAGSGGAKCRRERGRGAHIWKARGSRARARPHNVQQLRHEALQVLHLAPRSKAASSICPVMKFDSASLSPRLPRDLHQVIHCAMHFQVMHC